MVAKTRPAQANSGVAVGVGVVDGLAEGEGDRAALVPQAEPAETTRNFMSEHPVWRRVTARLPARTFSPITSYGM
jgi:hypothetical protein